METKELPGLAVRKRPQPAKPRRRVALAAVAKAIAAYSYMYAPLISPPTPPSAAPSSDPATGSPEKEVTLVQKYRGSWRGLPARSIRGHVAGVVDGVVAHKL